MEGIQTINALKAVMSSLPAQTTIPSGELVMLYATDGTPIAKISRDDLVKAVASVMASNSQTAFSKLLGVQANGTPMGIGASDLASVLGAYNGTKGTLDDPINALDGITYYNSITGGLPSYVNIAGLILKWSGFIIYVPYNRDYFIFKTILDTGWSDWKKIATTAI